jgi:hypothetical protein
MKSPVRGVTQPTCRPINFITYSQTPRLKHVIDLKLLIVLSHKNNRLFISATTNIRIIFNTKQKKALQKLQDFLL